MDPTVRSWAAPRSYQDFVPPSDWIREQEFDKLVMQLPGFRKEQLKVQLDNFGKLRTSGEHHVDGNRWQRFHKEFRIPENCNTNEIRAKFENGILTVTLPKLITTQSIPPVLTPSTQAVSPPPPKAEPTAPTVPSTRASEPQTMPESRKPEYAGTAEVAKEEEAKTEAKLEEKAEYGVSGLAVALKRKRMQLVVNVAIAIIVLVGVGIYVSYKFRMLAEAETAEETEL